MTKAEHFHDALTREGLFPEPDDDGDLRFKYEGGHYVLFAEPDDEPYVRVLFPNFWSIDSDDERERAYHAASVASRRCKGAKVWLRDDETDVCASIEAFLPGPEYLEYVLARMLSALQYAARQFRDEMQPPPADDGGEAAPGDASPDLDAMIERFLRDADDAPPATPPDDGSDDSPGDRLATRLGDEPGGSGDEPGGSGDEPGGSGDEPGHPDDRDAPSSPDDRAPDDRPGPPSPPWTS